MDNYGCPRKGNESKCSIPTTVNPPMYTLYTSIFKFKLSVHMLQAACTFRSAIVNDVIANPRLEAPQSLPFYGIHL
jgi:hypothetical protein